MTAPTIDAGGAPGKITSMVARMIKAAMRSSIEELITPRFDELKKDIRDLRAELREMGDESRREIQAICAKLNEEKQRRMVDRANSV